MVNDNPQVLLSPRDDRRDIVAAYLSEIIALAVIISVGLVGLFASMGGA